MTVTAEPPLPPTRSRHSEYEQGALSQQRDWIARLLRVGTIYLCGLLVMGLASLAGWIPAWQVAVMLMYCATGWAVFYTLIRSGWSARLSDPSLDLVLTTFGMSTVVAVYAMMEIGRGLALQLICVVLVAHIDRLRLRQAMLVTFGGATALIATLAALWWFTPECIDLRIEIYNLALVTVLLPIAGFLINETHHVSTRALQQSGTLLDTLSRLREQALQDRTTGLPNRRHMTRLILKEIKRQGRIGQPFCLTFFEIERSAPLATSDARVARDDDVLRQVAQLAGRAISPADTLACWSPERLLLMQPVTQLADALGLVSRVQQTIREYNWARQQRGLVVNLAAGSTEHFFSDSLDLTIERAERALRRAQQGGAGCHATEPDLPAQALSNPPQIGVPALNLADYQPASATPSAPSRSRMRPVMRVNTEHGAQAVHRSSPFIAARFARHLQGLADLLLSADPAIREHLRLPLAGSAVYALWLLLLHSYALPHGLVTPGFARWLTGYDLIGMLAFYPLVRSGWSARWEDARLILAQMLYGCGACAICYATTPDLRTVALQVMCFIQLFGMASLTAKQTRVIAGSVITMQCAALAWSYANQADGHRFLLEVLMVATSCLIVVHISLQSYRFGLLRERVHAEQDTLQTAIEQIRNQLTHDALTGLLTERSMNALLDKEIARVQRSGRSFCVALIGLDHFESSHGRYSYAATDDMLARFGPIARTVLRETDALSRWPDHLLLALLPDTETGPQGVLGLERLRQHIAAQPASEDGLRVTMSCGIAEFRAGEAVARLLERAGRGLYAARASGSNRCVLAD